MDHPIPVAIVAIAASVAPVLIAAQPTSTPDSLATPTAVTPEASNPAPLEKVGGSVSPPSLLSAPEPQFSPEARKARKGGIVLVNLIVDANGQPLNIHVLHGVGMGLDEQAIDAVKQYRFKPAMKGDKPVAVELNVQVNFQIFDKPMITHTVPIEVTQEARDQKASGSIQVVLTVGVDGQPHNVRVFKGVGMGMDEKAIEAVQQYSFKPFKEHGEPVERDVFVDVKFSAK